MNKHLSNSIYKAVDDAIGSNVFHFKNGENFVYFTCVFDNAGAIIS